MIGMRVKNSKLIRTLTWRTLKAGKFRNMVAVCAIALTAILFTTVFSIGGNIIASVQNATMRQVGNSTHGLLKYLTQAQYDNFKESPLIKDISYNIFIGIAENEALQKKQTEIRYGEDKAAKWVFSYPAVGTMPEAGMELACSTLTLDMLDIPHELGQRVPLEFTVHGKEYSEEFTLCGFWPGDDVMRATQVWLSREYTSSIVSVPLEIDMSNGMDGLVGTINAGVWFGNSLDIEGKMGALVAERGYAPGEIQVGINWAYMGGAIDPTSVITVCFLVLLILISGYLIIYSVFTISVTGDIRFYGLLKTIGTTGRQLRRVVRGQALLLSIIGIPLGLLIGWLLGYALTPVVMSITNLKNELTMSANPFIFFFAAAFSLVTVFISCRKPGRIAARVSPVEAVRFTDAGAGRRKEKRGEGNVSAVSMAWANVWRGPKKLMIVVLSLSLSLILLNSVYSIVSGFDMEKYLEYQITSDFSAADHSVYTAFSVQKNFEGVDDEFLAGVSELPGLESMADIYFRDDYHRLSPRGHENMIVALDFLTPRIEESWPRVMEQVRQAKETGSVQMCIYAAGHMAIDIITQEAPIDFERLASGDYALISHVDIDYDNECPPVYGVGDKIPLINADGEMREFEVLAVIPSYPYPLSCQYGHIIESNIVLADNVYLDFYGDRQPMMTIFNVDDEHIPAAEEWIAAYCENGNPSLDYRSREFYKSEFNNMRSTYYVLGGALSFILALIGILNLINAVFTSIFTRRRELAMLQSVGMTGKQLKSMLFYEGAFHAILTVLFTATAGTLFAFAIIKVLTRTKWFFTWSFTLMPLALAILPLLLVCALVPLTCYRFMQKESVVERLREIG